MREKDSSSAHNFETDGLELYEEDGFLKAKGTTLGADNGVAVAYMLALLDDKSAKHPKIGMCLHGSRRNRINRGRKN
ncbi:hypothetical protein MGH68_12240 [Erysipelothrix sp. D19-032]